MFNDFVGLASKVMVEDGTSLNNKIPLELLFGSPFHSTSKEDSL
jgi:hypothetical protein